jgi:hypothetical protein
MKDILSEENSKKVGEKMISKWDSPSSSDRFGREPFVDTIVKTIESSDEGFNLGISARWGEGKSSILRQLRPKLESLNYKVLSFEPWKYTQDAISIKRKFIIDIYSQLGKKYDEAGLYNSIEKEKNLGFEEYYEAFVGKLGTFGLFSMIGVFLFIALLLLFQSISGVDINITQIFLTNLFIPILVGFGPLLKKITEVTIKQTIPKVESAEQFEVLFNMAIKEIMDMQNPPKRIVIFVDDLDRCNHIEVEQILTALFTFFNNRNCIYVITADHTVIRRYISNFLQLEDEVGSNGGKDIEKTNHTRQKEATEYLKKIFQINFILPKIPSDLLELWVRDLLEINPIVIFKNPYAKDYLINLLLNNFQGNPRKIKHFIRTLAFQLEAISKKMNRLSDKTGEEYKNLNKVKESPELLAKILILQDRFPDFYELITSEPKLLQRREEGEIAEDKELQNLLAQEPKFFNSVTRPKELKTIDPYYFLYFSGSTGYVETKVVDPAEIKALARSADFDGLSKIISGLTDEPRNAQVELIKKEYDVPAIQPPEKVNVVRSLLHAISLIEETTLRLQNLNDIIDAKTKYAVEFLSLQSVDFEKFISRVNLDTIERLLIESPFSDFVLQNQILKAFISKQYEINVGGVSDAFIKVISDGLGRADTNFGTYLELIKKITPENLSKNNLLQESLIETYIRSKDSLKLELFDVILGFKNNLMPDKQQEFDNIILAAMGSDSISESIAMINNIPQKINKGNFDFSKSLPVLRKRVIASDNIDLEKFINVLLHPALMSEIGPTNMDVVFNLLADVISESNSLKVSLVISKLPDIISLANNKSALLRKIIQIIFAKETDDFIQVLGVVKSMDAFWSLNLELKKEFVKELRVGVGKLKRKEIKKTISELLSEFESSSEINKKEGVIIGQ